MPAERAIQNQLVGCVRRGALVEYPGVLCFSFAGQNTIEATATQAGRGLVGASIQAKEAAGSAIGALQRRAMAARSDGGRGGERMERREQRRRLSARSRDAAPPTTNQLAGCDDALQQTSPPPSRAHRLFLHANSSSPRPVCLFVRMLASQPGSQEGQEDQELSGRASYAESCFLQLATAGLHD